MIAVAAGTGLLFPASGLSEESPAENPLIAQLTEAALSGDLIEGDRLAAEYTAGREKDIAENGAPEFLPADDTVHLLLAQCCLVAGDPAGACLLYTSPVRLSIYSSVCDSSGDSFLPLRLSHTSFRMSYALSVNGMVR